MNEYTYKLIDGEIILRSDGASIPMDDGNRDYREYLEWVADGGKPEIVTTPEPKPVETLEERISAVEKSINDQSAILISKGIFTEEEKVEISTDIKL